MVEDHSLPLKESAVRLSLGPRKVYPLVQCHYFTPSDASSNCSVPSEQLQARHIIDRAHLLKPLPPLLRAAVVVLKLFQTPGDDVAGGRHGRKAIVGATDLQDLVEALRDLTAVAPSIFVAPCHHSSIRSDGREGMARAKDVLHVAKCDAAAVSTEHWMTPSHNFSISQQGSKGTSCTHNLLHILEPILHVSTVTSTRGMPPRDHGHPAALLYQRREGGARGADRANGASELELHGCHHHA